MSRRSEQLKALVAEFTRIHDAWSDDENRKVPDAEYWDAVDHLVEGFAAGDIPSDCREIAAAVDALIEERTVFDSQENPNPYPHREFWEKRELVAKSLEATFDCPLPPLESIPTLVEKQKVGPMQVALIYGFRDRRGNLMPHLVQQELDKPGSVLKTPGAVDGHDWIDPRLVDKQNREQAAERHSQELSKRKARTTKKPCPESPQQLFDEGVSIQQAALMLCQSEEDVTAHWQLMTEARDAAELEQVTPKGKKERQTA